MRRYAYSGTVDAARLPKFDVIIVGAGIAGLYTALRLDPKLSVAVLTKQGVDISNSYLAQGGIAAAIASDDTPLCHFEDTVTAGAGLCDDAAVRVLVDEGPGEIRTLQEWNVPFDLNADGELSITREGGHSRNRIVHAGGDATGRETVKRLAYLAARRDNITFLPFCFFIDVLTDSDGVYGALVFDENFFIIHSRAIVICAGGAGQAYLRSTNPSVATGDGVAAAIRAGARARSMEFIQFHPTALYVREEEERTFLISEALRGEGGFLKNSSGERLMLGRHDMAELAPRDIVAREIVREMRKSGEACVFLDITMHTADFLFNRFPTIYSECLRRGIDISKSFIPVRPVQHYMIGGITTSLNGMSDIRGLYAVGESASTGVHGANRLASNSMLECLVFGRRAAEDICGSNRTARQITVTAFDAGKPLSMRRGFKTAEGLRAARGLIKNTMDRLAGVIRTESGLMEADGIIGEILARMDDEFMATVSHVELLNLATIAKEIVDAALSRRESVGAHYREG